jgi:hypothetical protein
MSNQNAFIRHSLNQIRGLIQQQKLVQLTASKATRVGDPQQQAFWDKLGLQETALRRLLRQLHQKAVTFEWERTHLWRIPRHQRYPVRQSIDGREAVTLDLVELAEITLRELLAFGGDAARMRAGDWETLGQNVTETVAKQLTHAVVQQLQKGPAFIASNALPGLGLEHLAPLVGLLVAYIASKRRKH